MDCATVSAKIDELREGALSEVESSEMRKHIAGCRGCRDLLSEAEAFDKELGTAFATVQPPSDFVARTARAASEVGIEPVSIRPVVWVAIAAAACLVLAFGLNALLPDGSGRRGSVVRNIPQYSPSGQRSVGRAFSIGRDGRIRPYPGRTDVEVVWSITEGVPVLRVDAFPGAE
jgi:hypothetical protein